MDSQRFDRLTRAVAASTSRRQALGLLAAMAVAGWRPPAVAAAQGATACEAGLTSCPDTGGCVDLLTDLNNCGACGSVCESGLVAVRCENGECVRADCPVGITYCGAVDGCRDLTTDPAHCGACQNPCASGLCAAGVCADGGGCAPGQAECDGVCVDTCCNNDHCGACGNACTVPFTCFEGQCDCPSGLCCADGETICNGACVATCCDNNNCGACGNVCTGGFTCFEGKCDCPSGVCELPDTGAGVPSQTAGASGWTALATAGAAAAVALWRGVNRAPARQEKPSPER